jgi:hypothetical protein
MSHAAIALLDATTVVSAMKLMPFSYIFHGHLPIAQVLACAGNLLFVCQVGTMGRFSAWQICHDHRGVRLSDRVVQSSHLRASLPEKGKQGENDHELLQKAEFHGAPTGSGLL